MLNRQRTKIQSLSKENLNIRQESGWLEGDEEEGVNSFTEAQNHKNGLGLKGP